MKNSSLQPVSCELTPSLKFDLSLKFQLFTVSFFIKHVILPEYQLGGEGGPEGGLHTFHLRSSKAGKDCADLHGHFQACHTLTRCLRVFSPGIIPTSPLHYYVPKPPSEWEARLSQARLQVSAEKTLALFPSLPPFLSPSLPDKSKWNGSFHPSYLGQAMEYAVLCREMERNDLWPTKRLQITIYSLIWVLTVGVRRAASRHSLPNLWGLCVSKCIFPSPMPINADRNQCNDFSEGICLYSRRALVLKSVIQDAFFKRLLRHLKKR